MKYGVFGTIYMAICLVYTKLFLPQAKIVRLPFDFRNRKFVKIGSGLITGKNCRIEAEPDIHKTGNTLLFIGENVQMNDFCHITAGEKVVLGNHVLLASKVYISDTAHGSYDAKSTHSSPETIPSDRPLITKPVIIEDRVWLGDGVCVLPGVTIGAGSIIGANSVVTKSIPAGCIAAGIPAKIIKKFNFETQSWENASIFPTDKSVG